MVIVREKTCVDLNTSTLLCSIVHQYRSDESLEIDANRGMVIHSFCTTDY